MVWYRTSFILLYEYRPGLPFSRTQFILQLRAGSLPRNQVIVQTALALCGTVTL